MLPPALEKVRSRTESSALGCKRKRLSVGICTFSIHTTPARTLAQARALSHPFSMMIISNLNE